MNVRRALGTFICIAATGIAGAAWAGTAEVGRSCQKLGCTDHITYEADPGERNDVRVTGDDDRMITYEDRGATVRAGPGCRLDSERVVTCTRSEFGATYRPSAHGGDRDDRLEDAGTVGVYLYGEEGDDVLIGSGEFQYLDGGPGADRLEGNGGGDVLVDGDPDRAPADDTLIGGDGEDSVDYQGARRSMRIDMTDPGPDGARGERDVLISIESLMLGAGDDRATGDDGPNRITNSAGDDRIETRGGDDQVRTGPGSDRVSTGAGDDVVETLGQHEELKQHEPDRLTCGSGSDRVFYVFRTDVVGGDCETVSLAELGATIGLRLPLAGARDAFAVIARRGCSAGQARVLSARVRDRAAPAGGVLGRAAAGCSARNGHIREVRLALSRAGAAYLRRVGSARVELRLEDRFADGTRRGGFWTTLRHPAARR